MLLKQIELIMENCEVITIDGRYIGRFDVSNIERYISRMAVNAIDEREVCHHFAIEIHKDANKLYAPFEIEDEAWEEKLFERLTKFHDITGIDFILYDPYKIDEKSYSFGICYDDGMEDDCIGADNIYQSSYISKAGHLYILIDDSKNGEDKQKSQGSELIIERFGDDIDDPESMDRYFQLLDVPKGEFR